MCEIFGVTAKNPVYVNDYLKELVRHSKDHPNGWGIATFYEYGVNVEKEPIIASKSNYLKEILRNDIYTKHMLMHIRLATKGGVEYVNCHPFVKRDISSRAWTLIHNGTIFECPLLDKFVYTQKGKTDSERILCYIIDRINDRLTILNRPLTSKERFTVVDQILCEITKPNNKVNLLLYDGELTYVHSNLKNTLHYKRLKDAIVFSTVPLDQSHWEPIQTSTLFAYKEDKLEFIGTNHQNEYLYNAEDMKYLYLDMAAL